MKLSAFAASIYIAIAGTAITSAEAQIKLRGDVSSAKPQRFLDADLSMPLLIESDGQGLVSESGSKSGKQGKCSDCRALGPKAGKTNANRAKSCPGYSTCNCIAGPGGFLECLSGGVTERCSSCENQCKGGDHSSVGRLLGGPSEAEFRCGCFSLQNGSPISCVKFDFPDDCIKGCDNGNAIGAPWREACRCHFASKLGCSPDKCFQKKVCGDDDFEPDECRCFCQSFFTDYGGPHENCVYSDSQNGKALKNCPIEGIRDYGRFGDDY